MKICRKCEVEKHLNSFGYRKAAKDNLKSWCKKCESKSMKERREANPERTKEIGDRSRIKNRLKRNLSTEKWRKNNVTHIKEYNKEYKQRSDVKEAGRVRAEKIRRCLGIPKKTKMPREEELRKANISAKKYYKSNKEKINIYKAKWMRKKMNTDIGFKLKHRLRTRIYNAVKGTVKSESTINLIGCSIEHLMAHLESGFTEGMSFDNYGRWHVDHVIPCAKFDLTKGKEQKKCFNYKNLQPLWAFDNMSKGAR